MSEEKRLYDAGVKLKESDKTRNSIVFEYYAYHYNPKATYRELKSSLTSFGQKI
jgi:hypothetical protein